MFGPLIHIDVQEFYPATISDDKDHSYDNRGSQLSYYRMRSLKSDQMTASNAELNDNIRIMTDRRESLSIENILSFWRDDMRQHGRYAMRYYSYALQIPLIWPMAMDMISNRNQMSSGTNTDARIEHADIT